MSVEIEKDSDVVVIGAGISGCATAYNLARRGQKVVVLEKDDIAFEASGRTMAAVGLVGKHHADEFKLAQASMELWNGLSEELGADIELIKGGRLAIANTEEDAPLFQEMVQGAEESGVSIEWLEPQDAKRRWPFLEGSFKRAAYSRYEGHVNPVKTVQAFARTAREYGARFYTGCMVQDVGVSAGRVTAVSTNLGEIKTGAVVNASGVWASRLADRVGVHIPIQLVRVVQGETEPLPRLFDSFIRGPNYGGRQTASGAFRITGGYRRMDVYHDLSLHDLRDLTLWVPRLLQHRKDVTMQLNLNVLRHDFKGLINGLVPGKTGEVVPVGLEPRRNHKNLERKLARLTRLIPRLKGLGLTKTWAGYVDLTPDLLPVIGPVERPKGMYLATGFSGHGFAIGPIVGKIMADLVLEGGTSLPLHTFRPSRFSEEKVPMPRRLV